MVGSVGGWRWRGRDGGGAPGGDGNGDGYDRLVDGGVVLVRLTALESVPTQLEMDLPPLSIAACLSSSFQSLSYFAFFPSSFFPILLFFPSSSSLPLV